MHTKGLLKEGVVLVDGKITSDKRPFNRNFILSDTHFIYWICKNSPELVGFEEV